VKAAQLAEIARLVEEVPNIDAHRGLRTRYIDLREELSVPESRRDLTRGRGHNALCRCHSTKAAESLEPCHMGVKPRLRFAKRLAEIERRRLPDNCILIDDTSLLSVALPSILSQHQSGEWHCKRGTDHRH